MLIRSPILWLPNFDRPFILQANASDYGVGVALLQRYENGLFPIAYASKKLLPREKNYSVMERNRLAIVFGIRKFQKYFFGAEFVLQTDHAPLSYIQKCKVESGRIMRWALFLQNYQFKVEAIKGSNFFWKYTKARKQDSMNIGTLKSEGTITESAESKTNLLNKQFVSVFTKEDLTNIPDKSQSSLRPMNDIIINENGVKNVLNS